MADRHADHDHETYACNCGDVFDTLEKLKTHAGEHHLEVYEEKFAD